VKGRRKKKQKEVLPLSLFVPEDSAFSVHSVLNQVVVFLTSSEWMGSLQQGNAHSIHSFFSRLKTF